MAVLSSLWPPQLSAQTTAGDVVAELTLSNYVTRVLQRNETVLAKLIEMEAVWRKAKAERGIFEPELFGSYDRVENDRENTVEQYTATFSDVFWEKNNIYQSGIEGLVPTGARIRLGVTLRDLENNLQERYVSRGATNGEYQTFVGLSLVQPLLKNAGPSATMAGIRIAALESDIAFQEYRRQLMLTVATAEASYWNLFLAQAQVRFFTDSLRTAERILQDNRQRLEAGKGSQLDVLEAEAGVALRRSKLSEAEQKLYEASSRALTLCSESVVSSNRSLRAVDQPQVRDSKHEFFQIWQTAYELNPEYHVQRFRVMQEANRLGYARNQRLPELNLKGSYGFNGLGDTPSESWDDIEHGGFPAWMVGVELRVPIVGGIKTANELAAARLRYRASQHTLREVETQMVNTLDTALHKIQSAGESVRGYRTVEAFNQNLLDSALARLEVGKVESRRVLDIESDLFEARNSVAEALVQFERAELELELMQGAVLRNRNLDLSRGELSVRTAQFLKRGGLSDERIQDVVRQVQQEYGRGPARPASTASASTETVDPLREALRRRIEQTAP